MEIEKTSDNVRVFIASFMGIGTPTPGWFIDMEPYLKVVLVICQVAVAVITGLYIFTKWRNLKKK